jgi:aarF domain-containing kinase
VNPKEIGKLFAKLVINMIHKKGFVHGDPHGGNLKVRLSKNNVSELIILDHGLYQELSD